MYKYLILSISLISLQICAQDNKTKAMDEKVTEILGNLYKDVKNRDQAISYRAIYFIGGCNFELLINDFPIMTYFGAGDGSLSESAPINTAILRSGEQSWKIRVYPVHDKKEINGKINSVSKSYIQDGARVELAIEGILFKGNGDIEKRFAKVVDFEAPLKKNEITAKNVFADTGKSYIEYSGTFQADVPYKLEGWTKSEDLSIIDKSILEGQLLKKYKEYSTWLKSRNLEKIALSNLKSEKEYAQAHFFNEELNHEFLEGFINGWGKKSLTMYPIENYTMKFYGNGKLATLQRTDHVGDTVLAGWYLDENEKRKMKTFTVYFHIPKGKKELEVIR